MSRFPIPFASTIPALATVLLLTIVAEPAAADPAEFTPGSLNFETVSSSAATRSETVATSDDDDDDYIQVITGQFGGQPGQPVPTLICDELPRFSDEQHCFGVSILFNEPVSGFLPGHVEVSRPAGVHPFSIMGSSPHPHVTSFGYGACLYSYSSPSVPNDELEMTVRVPAGVVSDSSGESNTASNTLHVSVNRTVSVADASATEGTDATIDFEVTVGSRNDCDTVTVDWTTADGTATAGEDYFAARGTLTFGPGENSKTVSVPVLNDTVSDDGETVTLRLSNATWFATIDDAEATGVISDSEPLEEGESDTDSPAVTVTSEAVGPVSGDFDVTLTFSEPTSDFEMSEIEVVNGSATSMSSRIDGMVRTVTITPNSDTIGTLTVTVPAGVTTDAANNANTASEAFGIDIDTVVPSVTVTSDATAPVSGAALFRVTIRINTN